MLETICQGTQSNIVTFNVINGKVSELVLAL